MLSITAPQSKLQYPGSCLIPVGFLRSIHLLLAAAHFDPKNCPLTDPAYISQIHHVLAKICKSRLAKSLRKKNGKFSSVKKTMIKKKPKSDLSDC
jgi:hypothetical protein